MQLSSLLKRAFSAPSKKPRYKIRLRRWPLLGEGFESKVHRAKLISRTSLVKKKKTHIALRRLRTPSCTKAEGLRDRAKLINAKRVWREFRASGLPVASFFVPVLRRGSKEYLSVIMENLRARYGKIIPINCNTYSPAPVFLKRLNVKRDLPLIKNLAGDYAKMVNLGYAPHYVDFWAFYKSRKGTNYERIIVDIYNIYKGETELVQSTLNNLAIINNHLGKEENTQFLAFFLSTLRDKTLAKDIERGIGNGYLATNYEE